MLRGLQELENAPWAPSGEERARSKDWGQGFVSPPHLHSRAGAALNMTRTQTISSFTSSASCCLCSSLPRTEIKSRSRNIYNSGISRNKKNHLGAKTWLPPPPFQVPAAPLSPQSCCQEWELRATGGIWTDIIYQL